MFFTIYNYFYKYFQRDPQWIHELPDDTRCPLLTYVNNGNLCRNHLNIPDMTIKYKQPYPVSAIVPTFILTKCPVLSAGLFKDPNTKKPSRSYAVFDRLHGISGCPNFLNIDSHHNGLYKTTRNVVFSTLMREAETHYADVMCPVIEEIVTDRSLKRLGPLTMHKLAITMITRIGFGETNDTLDQELFENTIWIMKNTMEHPVRTFLPVLDRLPGNTELWGKQKRLRDAIQALIERKRNNPGTDIVSELLKMEASDKELIGILSVFFFAGFDTTANTMSMVLYHLAKHKDVQDRARQEAQSFGKLTWDNVFEMKYLHAVINEVLRLFPTVPTISRNIPNKFGLKPRVNEKHTFGINVNIFGVHRDGRGWENPDVFNPDRWLEKNSMEMTRYKQFMPFSLGKRSCLGKQFALVEMLTTLHIVLLKYDLSLDNPDKDPVIFEFGTLMPDEDSIAVNLKEIGSIVLKDSKECEKYEKKCLVNIDGSTYDLTDFDHPGGNSIIRLCSNESDASDHFHGFGHSQKAVNELKKYLI